MVRERLASSGSLLAVAASTAELLETASESLSPAWRYRPAARDLVQQVLALAERLTPYPSEVSGELTERLLSLRRWGLWCLNQLGDSPSQAVQYGQSLVPDYERILGPDHPDTLTSRSYLAAALREAGRNAEAIPLLEHARSDCERILGPDHPDTLASRGSLAAAYREAGRTAEAIALLERVLADDERILGPEHRHTRAARNNLAMTYGAAGRTAQAIPLLEGTLADAERVLDPDHPDTLTARNNLAMAYEAAGRT